MSPDACGLLRVVSWNVDARGSDRTELRTTVLRALHPVPDILLLQEVRRHDFEHLANRLEFDGFCSLDVPSAISGRKVGTAIFVRRDWRTSAPRRLPDGYCYDGDIVDGLPFKMVAVDVEIPSRVPARRLTLISAHARPAAGRFGLRERKPAFHSGVARWIAKRRQEVVLGIDANAPDVDHEDPARVTFGWPRGSGLRAEWGEDDLLGISRVAGLHDALRDTIVSEPKRVERRSGREPLAVSHILRKSGVSKRYDHILLSAGVTALKCSYDLAAGRRGGSDHAIVAATLRVSDPRGRPASIAQ